MEPFQILLIIAGLVIAGAGVFMLSRARTEAGSARGPYVPLAFTFLGLMLAYRAYSDYRTLEPMDLLIIFLFIVALLTLLGVQFFVVERAKKDDTK